MKAYASRTGTRRNLAFLKANGWRLMVSAKGVLRSEGMPYALDNGAWWAYANGRDFDGDAFERALDRLGECADFIVLPDVVCGGLRSLDFSLSWLRITQGYGRPVLLPVQNGMSSEVVAPHLKAVAGIFIGGDTEFKESTLPVWTRLAREHGSYVHVGRVNSRRRLKLCRLHGADSFDGSGPSRFLKHGQRMDAELRQGCLRLFLRAEVTA